MNRGEAVRIRLFKAERAFYKRKAAERGMKMTEFIRLALAEFVRKPVEGKWAAARDPRADARGPGSRPLYGYEESGDAK